ncbi:hypothetical protein EDC18_1045 [Natranaerovirga pectinivora]|uniref:Uncharacterized protein n=1 Tax=Natranaerovirga pectinivora TaxID=682400 RepID=A0A4R3MKG4_9FIRM|nr:hypothetical protein EDC18_1045 [Natranaerovirga pectinivora]
MREIRTLGSVRGASGNRWLYRDYEIVNLFVLYVHYLISFTYEQVYKLKFSEGGSKCPNLKKLSEYVAIL